MGKRRKRTKSDPCERLRKRLEKINERISEILDDLSNFDIPPGTRRRLEQMLKALQNQRTQVLKLLEKCEMMHARRATKGAAAAARKRRKAGR